MRKRRSVMSSPQSSRTHQRMTIPLNRKMPPISGAIAGGGRGKNFQKSALRGLNVPTRVCTLMYMYRADCGRRAKGRGEVGGTLWRGANTPGVESRGPQFNTDPVFA